MTTRKLIIGITGASGTLYGVRLLQVLHEIGVETHLIISPSAEKTREYETELSSQDIKSLASHVYAYSDIAAGISSGSFRTDGMIVAPCSMKTLAEIATGVTANLISRAADVILKERRRLVLLTRETPLTTIHIKNMLSVTEAGAIVMPPVPAFYAKPKSLDDIVNHTVGRVLDLFSLDHNLVNRWRNHP